MSEPSITIKQEPDNDEGYIAINGRLKDLPKLRKIANKYIDKKILVEIQKVENGR